MARINLRMAFCALALSSAPFLGGCVVAWPLLAAQLLLSDNTPPANGAPSPEAIGRLYAPISAPGASRAS